MSQEAVPAILCDLLSLSWRNGGDRQVPKLARDGIPLATTCVGVGHEIPAGVDGVSSWILGALGERIEATQGTRGRGKLKCQVCLHVDQQEEVILLLQDEFLDCLLAKPECFFKLHSFK